MKLFSNRKKQYNKKEFINYVNKFNYNKYLKPIFGKKVNYFHIKQVENKPDKVNIVIITDNCKCLEWEVSFFSNQEFKDYDEKWVSTLFNFIEKAYDYEIAQRRKIW